MLTEPLTGQQQFREVVEPSLFQDVVFLGDRPGEWFPFGKNSAVVIRPDRVFGAPHVAGSGVRTDMIAAAVAAEGNGDDAVKTVAAWFAVSEAGVRDAVAAEKAWQPPLAA